MFGRTYAQRGQLDISRLAKAGGEAAIPGSVLKMCCCGNKGSGFVTGHKRSG